MPSVEDKYSAIGTSALDGDNEPNGSGELIQEPVVFMIRPVADTMSYVKIPIKCSAFDAQGFHS